MATHDPRIDAYIAKAAPFAQPILAHLRALVHEACPEVEETIKWSSPFFLYRGMFCHIGRVQAALCVRLLEMEAGRRRGRCRRRDG